MKNLINIGKYTLENYKNHKEESCIFIRLNEGEYKGEGMETSAKDIEELIDKYYIDNF